MAPPNIPPTKPALMTNTAMNIIFLFIYYFYELFRYLQWAVSKISNIPTDPKIK